MIQILAMIIFWIFIWFIIGIVGGICFWFVDHNSNRDFTVEDLQESLVFGLLGPFTYILVVCFAWDTFVTNNKNKVLIKRRK